MLQWMVYVSVVSVALALSAAAGERAARLWRLPCRWLWCGALAGCIAAALLSWLVPGTPEPLDPAPFVTGPSTAGDGTGVGTVATTAADLELRLPEVDGLLLWGWLVLSSAVLAALAVSARSLAAQRRSCVAGKVRGRRVLLSDRLGPAVIGFVRPAIVLPRWVLDADRRERNLILAHEEEHLLAGDQRLVALSLLALVLTPWNPALWWAFHRLRQAIELDCDQRVLRGGYDVSTYGNLILRASLRPSVGLGYGSPFGEPAVSLERRISAMVTIVPRFRSLRGALAGSICLLLTLAAASVDRPAAQANPADPGASRTAPLDAAAAQDGRVTVDQVPALPDRSAQRDLIVLEVKAGPSYLINRQPVPVPELRSFIAALYAPRPWKVLFVQAAADVPAAELAAAVDAARAGLGEALDEERKHGGPGLSATVSVVRP